MNDAESALNYLEFSELKNKYSQLEKDIRRLSIENNMNKNNVCFQKSIV